MNNLLYARLAKTNLSKNRQNILPYLLSCIGTVVMFFIMDTLAQGSGFDSMIGKDTILTVMGMGTYIIGLFAVIFINSAMVMPPIDWNLSMVKMLLVALAIVVSGFFIGYLGSLLLKDRSGSMMITLMHNVGTRNNSCGLVIALTFFPPAVAVPITLSILYQQPVATIVSYFYRRYEKQKASMAQKAA